MPQSPPRQQAAPSENLTGLSLGYNGYTDPTETSPQMWAQASNVFSGAFGYIQRMRKATIITTLPGTTFPFLSLKYFALPTFGAWLLADSSDGRMFSYVADSGAVSPYTFVQRVNHYVDPLGAGNSLLAPPWSREVIQNIVYEMNGQVKQSGRKTAAFTIQNYGLDAPDAAPLVGLTTVSNQQILSIQRVNGVVTCTCNGAMGIPGGNGVGMINVVNVPDSTFDGTFVIISGDGSATFTWTQFGQNVSYSGAAGTLGTIDNGDITKSQGRSYAWAWENFDSVDGYLHVSAPSPSTQYIQYQSQWGAIQCIEPGTVTVSGTAVTGSGTYFTQAWAKPPQGSGRSLWVNGIGTVGEIASVTDETHMTLVAAAATGGSGVFQVYDPQCTFIRLYATADGGATYFRIQRNAFGPTQTTLTASGLQFEDTANAEPPNFPYTTETSQLYNLPPPIGAFIRQYQGRAIIFGVPGAGQSLFYSNSEGTNVGMPQESFAPLNQITLPIQNAVINGYLEFPGSAIILSDKQDMFRLTGLLSDNIPALSSSTTATSATSTSLQQGATISRLPYYLGAAHPEAMALTPLGGIWLTDNKEIWLFTDRYAPRNIGRPVQDILNSINSKWLNLSRMKYYHTEVRNWVALSIPANNTSFNSAVLVLDLDLLASNGSPSYFVFDMATNHPSWYVYNQSALALETVYEVSGLIRLVAADQFVGFYDIDYQTVTAAPGIFGTEVAVPNSFVTLHAWGNDSPTQIKRPGFFRFSTNRSPTQFILDGWSFQAQGSDGGFYTFENPLVMNMTPGVNDQSSLSFSRLITGTPFSHAPETFKVGSVNFVMGRRIRFQINFPSTPGVDYQFRGMQIGSAVNPPS